MSCQENYNFRNARSGCLSNLPRAPSHSQVNSSPPSSEGHTSPQTPLLPVFRDGAVLAYLLLQRLSIRRRRDRCAKTGLKKQLTILSGKS
jgi:hypothetical protein